MGVRFLVLIISFTILLSTAVTAVACADLPDFQNLVCGGTPDSKLGAGAVDICNVCYPCGAADGVCPEDFYTAASGQGSCRFCPDPDCLVTIDGAVEDIFGEPVVNANVVALYEPDIKEVIAITDASGYYQGEVRTGYIKLYVDFEDFDSKIVTVDVSRSSNGVVETVDFLGGNAIEPGSCRASCTDNFGDRCKASCDGINGCGFNVVTGPSGQVNVGLLCDDKLVGSRAFLPGSDTDYVLCCQGNFVYSANDERISTSPIFTGQLRESAQADDLVTFQQRTRLAGERVTIQVAVFGSEE